MKECEFFSFSVLHMIFTHFFFFGVALILGLFGFDKMGPETIPPLQIHYWNGIHKALTKLGAKVVVARVPR